MRKDRPSIPPSLSPPCFFIVINKQPLLAFLYSHSHPLASFLSFSFLIHSIPTHSSLFNHVAYHLYCRAKEHRLQEREGGCHQQQAKDTRCSGKRRGWYWRHWTGSLARAFLWRPQA